jgi:pimeloyl-ACP methyl ester carboxylesterase
MQRFTLTRRDGAPLAGYLAGVSGPVLVLANGLGGPVAAFRHQIACFETRFRVLTWDYRGLYASRGSVPPARVDVGAHADDLEDLLATVPGGPVILVGWSMGVQVALEFARRPTASVSHLVLINGADGRPMTQLRVPLAARWLPELIDRARAHHALGSRLFARASRSRTAAELARRLHLVSPRLGADEILDLAREFTDLDFDVYLRTLAALQRHDAAPNVGQLRAKTLVIAGGRDPLFSARRARELSERFVHGELHVLPKATHYAPLEFPEHVNRRIERFLGALAGPNGDATGVRE